MASPSPFLPAGSRLPAAEPREVPRVDRSAVQQLQDEGLWSGFQRRLAAWAADLRSPDEWIPWVCIVSLTAALVYSYLPSLRALPSIWANPQYQHG